MRRIKWVLTVAAVLTMLLWGGVSEALAATIQCSGGLCPGTNGNDKILESRFNDFIFGGGGKDVIEAKKFRGEIDDVNGGRGNDRINTADKDGLDTIRCGPGRDVVRADRGDRIIDKGACERISRS